MRIEIEVPDEVMEEVADIFAATEPADIDSLHKAIFGIGLLLLRKSGSFQRFASNYDALIHGLPMTYE